MSIPKVIHYCWFGKGKKSELSKTCIASWKRFCPDWEIKEWNEDNFDVNFCPYTAKAYSKRKYAYVSDVARLFIIYYNGGVYLDTDVELCNTLDDLLKYDAFFGYMGLYRQDGTKRIDINTGSGFGANAGNQFIKIMLEKYCLFDATQSFLTCNTIDTETFVEHWPNYIDNKCIEQKWDNMIVLDNIWKYTLHHCENSWLPVHKKMKNYFVKCIRNVFNGSRSK